MSENVKAVCEQVRDLIPNDPEAAFTALRAVLDYPGTLEDSEADWRQLFLLLSQVSGDLGFEAVHASALLVADNPESADNLYDFAYDAYEFGLHPMAATALAKAIRIDPERTVLYTELAANLEEEMDNAEALRVLASAPEKVKEDFLVRYLTGFHAAMRADIAAAEEAVQSLASVQDPDIRSMAQGLRGIVERYEEVPEPRGLREWHYILNDSLLLHLSPAGFEEPMHGRYAWVQDSEAMIHEGLLLLQACGLQPRSVASSTDRSSRVLALAAAQFFGAELAERPEDAELLITYDLERVGDADFFAAASQRRPDRFLWSHAACWTKPFPFAADFVTFLYQSNKAPWDDGQMTFDLNDKAVKFSQASESSDQELAEQIIEAKPEPLTTQGGPDSLSSFARVVLPAMARRHGPRCRQRTGGPVPSARFL